MKMRQEESGEQVSYAREVSWDQGDALGVYDGWA